MDGDAAGLEVLRDRLLVPPLDVQPDDRQAARGRVSNAMEGREASMRARSGWFASTRLTVALLGR